MKVYWQMFLWVRYLYYDNGMTQDVWFIWCDDQEQK